MALKSLLSSIPILHSLHALSLTCVEVTNRLEVDVEHCVLGSDSLSVVVPKHLAKEIEGLIRDELVVLRVHELAPGLARDCMAWQQVLIVRVQSQSVLVQVGI